MYNLAIDEAPGLSRIQGIQKISCDNGDWTAITNDGATHATTYEEVALATATVVPAAPDEVAYVVYAAVGHKPGVDGKPGVSGDDGGIEQHRIIAWAVSPFIKPPVPITTAGYLVNVCSGEKRLMVLTRDPDGKFRSSEGHAFDSLDMAKRWLDGGPKPAWMTEASPVPYPEWAWLAAARQPIPDAEAQQECMEALGKASFEYFLTVKIFNNVMEDKDKTLLATTAGSGCPIVEEMYYTPAEGCVVVNVSKGTALLHSNEMAIEELKDVYHGRRLYGHWSIVPRAEDVFALLGDEEMRCEARAHRIRIEANEHRARVAGGQPPPWMTQTAQPTPTASDC
jgi:hypothetical protein